MITVTSRAEMRQWCDAVRRAGRSVGFVPTMGFFHEGHRSLMRQARAAHDVVVVSIFVNPLQFGPSEDLDAYPRDLERDLDLAAIEGVDAVFAPTAAEMYPEEMLTSVHVGELGDDLCGNSRPGHFDGVATVVARLFGIIGPSTAYFGRKDAQQLAIVRRMARDLELPVTIVGCSLVREPDGLAMSSRNAYLTAEERAAAAVLSKALRCASDLVHGGERDPEALRASIENTIAVEPLLDVDYVEVRDADSFRSLEVLDGDVIIALAARVGQARLIDNCTISLHGSLHGSIHGSEVVSDLGVIASPAESEA